MSIKLRLIILLIIVFSAALGNSAFTFLLESHSKDLLEWKGMSDKITLTSEKLLSALKDAETGQRGYLLTQNFTYLKPYHYGIDATHEHLAKIRELTSKNKEQQRILDQINDQIQYKFAELKETIKLTQAGKTRDALVIISMNEGKYSMEMIRSLFQKFNEIQAIELAKKQGEFAAKSIQIKTITFGIFVFLLSMAIVSFIYLKDSIFTPLNNLIKSAEKVKSGQPLEPTDLIPKDEIGSLEAIFYEMGNTVHQRENKLINRATIDQLTGIKNRSTMLDSVKLAIDTAKISNTKVAILFIDLNKCKVINDTLGHDIGDLVLKESTARFKSNTTNPNNIFRLGGDEFIIILNDINTEKDAYRTATKIQQAFEEPAHIKNHTINLSLSIGIALSPDHATSNTALIECADIAMYAAKRDSNISCKVFEEGLLKRASDGRALFSKK